MSRILVTGASGFVGQALSSTLVKAGHETIGLVRRSGACVQGAHEWLVAGDAFEAIEQGAWPGGPRIDCVVHLAARVHVMHDTASDPLAAFRAANVEATMRVARAAHAQGVRRMVFVSSVKAAAETDRGRPLRESDPAQPQDAYGQSKREAEQALAAFGRDTGLEIVIVRPPLVYGPGVRANFLQLMRAVARGLPLPLALVQARRSVVFVDNLADALMHCAVDTAAAGQLFYVADAEAPTVAELARTIGKHLHKPARLLPIPTAWLQLAGRATGRSPQVERLTESLRLDCSHIAATLGWRPVHSLDEGLAQTARWYRSTY
jgi:UDP-glucose 4-epimerase